MNKSELIELVSRKTKLSKVKCEKVLIEFKNTIIEVLKKGEEVSLRNFGKFKVVETKARRCVNPITKRVYMSRPKKVTTFKSFESFKLAVK